MTSKGRKRAAVLVGVLLVAVAGVATIALGGVAADSPFTVSDSSADTSATSGSEATAGEEASPADDENSAAPPSPSTEFAPQPPDDQTEDSQAEGSQTEDSQAEDSQARDDQTEDGPGVNFVPGVRNFNISTEEFDESSSDVEDGFVTPGEHRLLRFDMIIYNAGDEDAELGRPEDRPDLFEHSDSHGHAHLEGFNKYVLFDESGERMGVGKKQTFCLRDSFQSDPNASGSSQFDCDYQGISSGWADEYDASLPGQYLVIDDLPDGNYTLQATTNAEGTIDETCDGDNTVRVDLHVSGDTVIVQSSQSDHVRASAC